MADASEPAAPTASDRIALAGSTVAIPPLGVGTWAWGDRSTWGMDGYDPSYTEATIRDAWQASIEAGVVLFDTAEVYGKGESERIIGRLLAEDPTVRDRVVLASKFMPAPQKLTSPPRSSSAARASAERLGVETIDLYQIHGPISLRSKDALAEALVTAQAEGLVKAVGVSNYSAKETRRIDAALRKRGARLATNQIEYSLLRTAPEQVGPARLLPRARRRAARVLADRPGPADRQVLRRQPRAEVAHVLRPPDGAGRRGGGRAAPGRRGPRPHPGAGGARLVHRQGLRAHPRRQAPGPGRAERRCPRLGPHRR